MSVMQKTPSVPGAPRVGSRVNPGVVPRPNPVGGSRGTSHVKPDRFTRKRAQWAARAARFR